MVDEVEVVDEGRAISDEHIVLSMALDDLVLLMEDEDDPLTSGQRDIVGGVIEAIEEVLGPSDASEDDDAEEGMEAE